MGGGILWETFPTYKLNNLGWEDITSYYDIQDGIAKCKCDLSKISNYNNQITKYSVLFKEDFVKDFKLELRSITKWNDDPYSNPMIFKHKYEDYYEKRNVIKEEDKITVEYFHGNYIISLDKLVVRASNISGTNLKQICENCDFKFMVLEVVK